MKKPKAGLGKFLLKGLKKPKRRRSQFSSPSSSLIPKKKVFRFSEVWAAQGKVKEGLELAFAPKTASETVSKFTNEEESIVPAPEVSPGFSTANPQELTEVVLEASVDLSVVADESTLLDPVYPAHKDAPDVAPEVLFFVASPSVTLSQLEWQTEIQLGPPSQAASKTELPEVPTSQSIATAPPDAKAVSPVEPVPPQSAPTFIEVAHRPRQLPLFETSLSTVDLVRPNDTLKQSIEAFLLDQRSVHTRTAYGKDLKRFIQFLLSRNFNQGVQSLNRTILITYKESLISEGLEHTTIDRHLATLRSFFKWLVDDGLIDKSPADGVRFLNPKRISRTIGFEDDEVKKILSLPDLHTRTGSLHYAVLMILFYCGLRRSEVCALRTTNVGVERKQKVLRLRGKGNAERVLVMIPPVWNALRHYFHISNRIFTEDQFLFLPLRNNRTGVLDKALDPSMIFYIVTKYAKAAGIANRVSPHSCRATAISNARDHHVPDRAIQEFAGWASPDMITRYDKRRTSVEDSAAHSIVYGAENRSIPSSVDVVVGVPAPELPHAEGADLERVTKLT